MSKATLKALVDNYVYENTTKSVTATRVNTLLKEMIDGAVEEPAADGVNGQVLTTDGNGGRQWTTVGGSSSVTVENNLTSTSTTNALSAAMGKKLNDDKQAKLVSGTSIKTVNNQSLLGSGNIVIGGSGGITDYDQLSNRPQINGKVLTGNKTAAQLGVMPIPQIDGANNIAIFEDDGTIYDSRININDVLVNPSNGEQLQVLTITDSSGNYGWADTLRTIISRANSLVSHLRRTYPGEKIDLEFVQDKITEKIGEAYDSKFDINGDGVIGVSDAVLFGEVGYVLSYRLVNDLETKVDTMLGNIESLLTELL